MMLIFAFIDNFILTCDRLKKNHGIRSINVSNLCKISQKQCLSLKNTINLGTPFLKKIYFLDYHRQHNGTWNLV